MDTKGARQLRKRLQEQKHWCQAEAVRDGRQPQTDPDLLELEGIGDGVRYYGCEQAQTNVDGRPARVSTRLTKTLTDGAWETALVRESVEYLD